MSNPHLVVEARQFGRDLIASSDLDPVYVMLNCSNLPEDQLARWCVVYWLAYRVDVATQLCDAAPFWPKVREFMLQTASPRGSERRHYRGQQAANSLSWLQAHYPEPEQMMVELSKALDWAGIISRVRSWLGFGEWISFKIADMADVVLQKRFDAPEQQVSDSFYSGVVEAAQLVAGRTDKGALPAAVLQLAELRQMDAPHWGPSKSRRKVGIQELETCLCKFASFKHGHYPLGKDTREVLHNLEKVRGTKLGEQFFDVVQGIAPKVRKPAGLLAMVGR